MKKKNSTVLVLLLFMAYLLGSCRQDTDTFVITKVIDNTLKNPDTVWLSESSITDTNAVRVLAGSLGKTTFLDSVNVTSGDTVLTPDNVRIVFPAKCANFANGSAVTGKAQMTFVVIQKKGDMIRADKPTVNSDGSVLISGGEAYVTLSQGGQALVLASGKSLDIRIHDVTATSTMQFFYGQATNTNQFAWSGAGGNTDSQRVGIWKDSNGVVAGYELLTTRLNWINADKFNSDSTNLTNLYVKMSADTFTNTNTMVFLAFRDINSVVKLWGDPSNKQFSIPTHYKGVPVGKVVSVITISKVGSNYYLGAIPNITISANMVVPVGPSAKTVSQITDYLQTL